jgi:hypothetical protein
MSADTFTWIAKFEDWYRICFSQAPDNLWYFPKNSNGEKLMCIRYFEWWEIFKTKEEAIIAANKMDEVNEQEDDWYINEYWTINFDFSYYNLQKITEEFEQWKIKNKEQSKILFKNAIANNNWQRSYMDENDETDFEYFLEELYEKEDQEQ